MLRQSPFHARVAAANETSLWSHWAGHLVVDKYQMSEKWEYVAIRNAVGVFDSSPLYKYRITGPDAERFLAGVLARDVRTCQPGQAQYTIWCDERGFVNEDGVVFRYGPDEFMLTAAEPNLAYLQDLVGYDRVEIEEISEQLGSLAIQGPRAHAVLSQLAPEVSELAYFDHTPAKLGNVPVTISRTGFTGDLGFEVFCDAGDADEVWDVVFEAGAPHGILPFGQIALLMARIEAGLLLIHVDFDASRLAENDAHRSTPIELGLHWMLKGIDDATRPFIGRKAILRARAEGTSRWKMMGLMVDPFDYHAKYTSDGMVPPKDHRPVHEDMMVYDEGVHRVGYATSFMYSPVLQRHIALARVRPDLAKVGQKVNLEFTINHRYVQVGAEVARNPMFAPARKTAPLSKVPDTSCSTGDAT
jgi:aminomethyltransferase